MAEVKWIKIVTDVFDDEKILLIDSLPERDGIIVIWFKMLCLAGKTNNGGVFLLNDKIAYTDEMLSTIFRRPVNTVRLALQTFEQFGMIEIINDVITIPNWDKHQSLDKLEQTREQTRKRVAKHREKQKALTACNVTCNTNVTQCNATDKIREDKNRKDIEEEKEKECKSDKPTRTRFVPPSLEDVQTYCRERQNDVDAQRFIDYYTSNGWKVGKNSMKDWKAAVRNWERTSTDKQDAGKVGTNGIAISQKKSDLDDLF